MLCSEKKSADRRAMASGVRCMAYEMGERSELYTHSVKHHCTIIGDFLL